jgi:hypothetical protein
MLEEESAITAIGQGGEFQQSSLRMDEPFQKARARKRKSRIRWFFFAVSRSVFVQQQSA